MPIHITYFESFSVDLKILGIVREEENFGEPTLFKNCSFGETFPLCLAGYKNARLVYDKYLKAMVLSSSDDKDRFSNVVGTRFPNDTLKLSFQNESRVYFMQNILNA